MEKSAKTNLAEKMRNPAAAAKEDRIIQNRFIITIIKRLIYIIGLHFFRITHISESNINRSPVAAENHRN